MRRIPAVDLKAQYADIGAEIDAAIRSVIADTAFVRGPYVKAFEEAFAQACGVEYCVSCANGTDAIFLALKSLGVGPGDEVITTASSWIATSEAISLAGATPVFVDIEPDFCMIDPTLVEARVTSRTKAVLPVHLYGQMADMDALEQICREHHLLLVEDCAQAHLASLNGRGAGTVGVAGTFSFYPGKNLGAYGDAGCVVTNDLELAEQVRMFASHGARAGCKHDHEIEGVNSRMDGLQAAILSAKLPHLEAWTQRRLAHADAYTAGLAGIPRIRTPVSRPNARHVFHLYVIRAERRDELKAFLAGRGVGSQVNYPTALPFLKAYERFHHHPGDFPVAAAWQEQVLSLPMFPELTAEQIAYVIEQVRQFYAL